MRFKFAFILLLAVMMSCSNKNAKPQKEENFIDSVMEKEGQKVKDVNEGIKDGFDESTKEL